jgi:hypothetical protein
MTKSLQKKLGCKHFITSWLHIEKNEPEMFTANKIYGREILGQKQNGAQEDKYQQRTASHKKLNKNIEQQHRPQQKLGELGCFRKVSSSCFLYNTRHVHDVVRNFL